MFFALGMGAAIHDGELGINTGQKALGSRVLFHPSGELGYRFDGVHSISVFFDHISNGYSRRDNEGMDTIGVRFGRRLVPFSAPPTDDGAIADFSGFYVGAMAGYQLERADWRASSLSPSRSDADDFHWAGLLGLQLAVGPRCLRDRGGRVARRALPECNLHCAEHVLPDGCARLLQRASEVRLGH